MSLSTNPGLPDIEDRLDGPAVVAIWGEDQPGNGFRLGTREYDWHAHARGQVFCVESGLIHMRTEHGSWLSPPHKAGWIPPGMPHQVSVNGAMSGWSVLITPQASLHLPRQPCVIGISDVMRALVQRAVSWSEREQLEVEQERLTAVLLDEIRLAPQLGLHLPLPQDRRLLRICNALYQQPDDTKSLQVWASWGGVSARTLSRLFREQTGLSFAQWRQQAKLSHALERLAQGESVAQVADALGYATPSNFIAMFRRSFGDSPAHYFSSLSSHILTR
ncbi:AraC family transcriptional regulator [Undibacterium sp. Ren11W]|uniref:AraC family transcriptional regulator n=1 Tax=Undibacterium sp. Ren11W TaxID=3413045 RepID=UPI003BF43822